MLCDVMLPCDALMRAGHQTPRASVDSRRWRPSHHSRSLSSSQLTMMTMTMMSSPVMSAQSLSDTRHILFPRCMECQRELAMRKMSVCPSVTRVNCDKTVERSVQIFIPHNRSFSLVFWEAEWFVIVRGDPFYLKFWVNRPPLERNCRFWTDTCA